MPSAHVFDGDVSEAGTGDHTPPAPMTATPVEPLMLPPVPLRYDVKFMAAAQPGEAEGLPLALGVWLGVPGGLRLALGVLLLLPVPLLVGVAPEE